MKKVALMLLTLGLAGGISAATNPPSPTPMPALATYTDKPFGFSIRYPLLKGGQRPTPKQNGWAVREVSLPTGDEKVAVITSVFTDESVKAWNANTAKNQALKAKIPPFPYPLQTLGFALGEPVGTRCEGFENGQIVDLNGQKVLKFHGVCANGGRITYIVQRGKSRYLQIDMILLGDFNESHLTVTRPIPWEVQQRLDAGNAVVKSVRFFKPVPGAKPPGFRTTPRAQ